MPNTKKQDTDRWASFPLGRILITSKADRMLRPHEVLTALERHARGDWGNMSDMDCIGNEHALDAGDVVYSVYRSVYGATYCVATASDRSVTTVRLIEEY